MGLSALGSLAKMMLMLMHQRFRNRGGQRRLGGSSLIDQIKSYHILLHSCVEYLLVVPILQDIIRTKTLLMSSSIDLKARLISHYLGVYIAIQLVAIYICDGPHIYRGG